MTKMIVDRAVVEQSLHAAMAAEHPVKLIASLRAALAEPTLQTCNCRWDGEVQVQQCTLHEAHVDAIHEWAERAKTAEKKLRRLSAVEAENETLKKTVEALAQAVARLQQHHATAWNRGHTMGMKANEDTARRALDAVKQDAWGNTQLTEALLKAEAQRDALLEALKELTGHTNERFTGGVWDRARAAIKAVEEGK